ncbi:MutS-related protein [Aliarcobacter cibarius]|uniref:DNA mismatch repair protein n=1 Tax=Aliarcobacter cibarius TaxID=255507 RepID=A0ABY2V5B9_9BACT|nr:DNA mismatch repair protein [Aliarcobacter cibarius]TLS95224.1 DNA mismatch repair protein [Aliarcobacter cibarius]TLS98333.1 DNA mismatch repair protein [Aliarcobacter cibarius]TLT03239.1 DNA mismatch repair protein [Aliarcobacter cibarius]
MREEVAELLENRSELLTITYFKLQELFEQKYGQNALVLMEIGTFFEVYEVNNDKEQIGKAKEIAELLNIQLTRKNKSILENSKENPIMAGVPAISFEKHLARIIAEQKYTIAIIRQKGTPPNVSRYLDVVVSPGTNFDFVVDQDDNFVTSIVVDQIRGNYLIGYSAIDVTTAKCYYNEVFGSSEDKFFALDEVFNYMNMHKTSEVILTIADKNINQKEIIDYLELNLKSYHLRNFRPKISYQNELFKNVFNIESLLTPIEHLDMERSPLSSESLAILIDFVIAHDSAIIQKLSNPIKLDISRYIYLGNNALEQLNIIDTTHNLSLIKLINNTSTAMGKRLLKERLTNPIKDAKELLRRYNLSKELYDYHAPIENELANIYDIERLTRRIKLVRLHPFELNYLYDSLISIKEIVKFMESYKFVTPPCSSEECESFIKSINSTFDLSVSGKFMLKDVDTNMITSGINIQIDELNKQNDLLFSKLEIIKEHILGFLKSDDESYVGINRLDKEGFFLTLTKNRFNLIKDELLKSHLIIDNDLLLFKDFTIKTQTNSVKISCRLMEDISDKYVHNLKKIVEINKIVFKEKLCEFEKKFATLLSELVMFIAEIDLTVSNIKTSKKYNYTCPKIVKTKDDENFIELIELRHPIIESNEESGIYVPNDIILGELNLASKEYQDNIIIKNSNSINLQNNKMHGVLLFGINSSGKSSLMKAIGISVIMAQAGFFVPCKSMRFSIFDSIFTRISGADNIAKGLSSFAVEMMDLKNIFNRATKKSLILGDEISHSTETLSGLSIVASAILKLARLEALFVFATHLHQLPQIPEIEKLKNIICLHLAVMYVDDEDKLVFNRKLDYGSGSSIYGLEFAKSLHMDREFLNVANEIRKRLSDDYTKIERLTHKNSSKYNSNLYTSTCTICGRACDDVHHIVEQSKANSDGFIGHINVNHKYNLIPLCKLHHKMVHDGTININGFVTTSKGLELHYTMIEK